MKFKNLIWGFVLFSIALTGLVSWVIGTAKQYDQPIGAELNMSNTTLNQFMITNFGKIKRVFNISLKLRVTSLNLEVVYPSTFRTHIIALEPFTTRLAMILPIRSLHFTFVSLFKSIVMPMDSSFLSKTSMLMSLLSLPFRLSHLSLVCKVPSTSRYLFCFVSNSPNWVLHPYLQILTTCVIVTIFSYNILIKLTHNS